jgi:hypothetical protein
VVAVLFKVVGLVAHIDHKEAVKLARADTDFYHRLKVRFLFPRGERV